MHVTDNRVLPLCSVRLYNSGDGDPLLISPAWGCYDILQEQAGQGIISRDAYGGELLEILPDVGLVCRPYLVMQHTQAAYWAVSGGTWEELRPYAGGTRVTRLCQVDVTANAAWQAVSNYSLPQNPSFALSLNVADAPSDQNDAVSVSYIRFEFGGGWAIEQHPSEGVRVLQWSPASGLWLPVLDLSSPGGPFGEKLDEDWFFVRCLRGRIFVSTDYGKSYQSVAGNAEAAPLVLRGVGRAAAFGVHQLAYYPGVWTAPTRRMDMARATAPDLLVTGLAPTGTSALATATNTGDLHGYTLTLTPAAVTAGPWACYWTPEVYSVISSYRLQWSNPALSYTTPWDGKILSVDIDLPYELDQGQAEFTVKLDSVNLTGHWRWRKCEIWLGEYKSDGSTVMERCFTGYIRAVAPEQTDPTGTRVRITLANATIRARRQTWRSSIPLGGQLVSDALTDVMEFAGIPYAAPWTDLQHWTAVNSNAGNVTLPSGTPEDPKHYPRRGDTLWQTMQEMVRVSADEIGVDRHGRWYAVQLGYEAPSVSQVWQAEDLGGSADIRDMLLQASARFDATDCATGVSIFGHDEQDRPLAAGIRTGWERWPGHPFYSPWPEELVEEDSEGATTAAALSQQAVSAYLSRVLPRREVTVKAPGKIGLERRMRCRVSGANIGVSGYTDLIVMTVHYHWERRLPAVQVEVGLRSASNAAI